MAKKKVVQHHKKLHKHLDPTVFMLLAFVVVVLLTFTAMQINLPLASFLKLR